MTNVGSFDFCKICKIPEKKFGGDRLKYTFFIFQSKDILNLDLTFPNLSLYLVYVMLIKRNVTRKN